MYLVAIQTSGAASLEVDEKNPYEIMKYLRQLQAYRTKIFLKPKKHGLSLHNLFRHTYQLSIRKK